MNAMSLRSDLAFTTTYQETHSKSALKADYAQARAAVCAKPPLNSSVAFLPSPSEYEYSEQGIERTVASRREELSRSTSSVQNARGIAPPTYDSLASTWNSSMQHVADTKARLVQVASEPLKNTVNVIETQYMRAYKPNLLPQIDRSVAQYVHKDHQPRGRMIRGEAKRGSTDLSQDEVLNSIIHERAKREDQRNSIRNSMIEARQRTSFVQHNGLQPTTATTYVPKTNAVREDSNTTPASPGTPTKRIDPLKDVFPEKRHGSLLTTHALEYRSHDLSSIEPSAYKKTTHFDKFQSVVVERHHPHHDLSTLKTPMSVKSSAEIVPNMYRTTTQKEFGK